MKNNYNFTDLKGKSVILIGGLGLIGKALSEAFANVNSNLIIADLAENNRFMSRLEKINKSKNHFFHFDISKENHINDLIKYCINKFNKIDVMVNCSFPRTNDWNLGIEKVEYDSVKKNLINQLGGYYNVTNRIALEMKKKRSGSIINFSSIYGLVGPTFNIYQGTGMTSAPAYALIKGGVNSMTRYFASYYGKYNIRVNCISPGGVFDKQNPKFVKEYVKLTPLGRMAQPEDLTIPTLFLASDGSKYITGHNLLVDGGWTIH